AGAGGAAARRRSAAGGGSGGGLGGGARVGEAARRVRLGDGRRRRRTKAQVMSSALAHELSCRFLQPILDLCEPESLLPLCAQWGVRLEQLRDQTNWVSLRFCE